jgi:hypothetical protein
MPHGFFAGQCNAWRFTCRNSEAEAEIVDIAAAALSDQLFCLCRVVVPIVVVAGIVEVRDGAMCGQAFARKCAQVCLEMFETANSIDCRSLAVADGQVVEPIGEKRAIAPMGCVRRRI